MTLFLSDSHLGNSRCRAEALCQFLTDYGQSETLYLVGDIFDDIVMRQWPRSHLKAIELILRFPEIIYLPGNHDAFMRVVHGLDGNITVLPETSYLSSDQKRYLVVHGDAYDRTLMFAMGPRWLRDRGAKWFEGWHARRCNKSLEIGGTRDARLRGFDGVICGHSHFPSQRTVDGIEYINCGDWLQNRTALIDRGDGLKLFRWG